MTQKNSKYHLLKSLLVPLLREWDYETVRQCLAEAQAEHADEELSFAAKKHKPAKEYRRPNAVEIVERLDAAEDRKESLRALAARFDTKTFLPTASDVRHFLEMRGQSNGPIKQRQDSFRMVVDVLLSMADDELMLLQTSGTHAGPTQLGPLSDAIKATSAAVRTTESPAVPDAVEESFEPQVKPAVGDAVKS